MGLQENCSSKIRGQVKSSLNSVSRRKIKKRELASRDPAPKFFLQRACDWSVITRRDETMVDDELIHGIARNKPYPEANQFRDRRSASSKRETFGNKFYTPMLNWTWELLKLRTGVL